MVGYTGLRKFKKYSAEINPLRVHTGIGGWRKLHAKPVCFFVFWWQKVAFKTSLDTYSYPIIIEFFWFAQLQFRIEEKIHTKAVADVFRDWKGARRKLSLVKLNQWIWMWNLYQNLILALLIVAVCTVLFLNLYMILRKNEPTIKELCNLFLQNIKNEIFQILKALENNMKFTKAFWINSKISNRGKNTTLIF